MDPPAPEIDPTTLYGQIMEAIERLRAERDRNAPTRKLDESLMRLVYQVAIADFHDPAVSSGLINFNVRFEVEQALMMVAEFLKTTEMHPNDASYVYQNIQDCQREGRLVSSDVFRPTNTKGALGDFWIHRLQADVCGFCKARVGHNRLTCPFKDGKPKNSDTLYSGKNQEKKVF